MIKTILWDIDGTVLDFLTAEKNSLRACFEKFNLGVCSDEMIAKYSRINQSYWERLERGELNKSQVLTQRFVEFLNGENITAIDARTLSREYESGLADTIVFIDNADRLLKALSKNYNQYAVTNGAFAVQQKKLKKSGLIDVFDGVFISDEVGFEKPSKSFFDYVMDNIKPCEKDEIMIVGDSLTSDMQGGNNIGIKCYWYNPKNMVNTKNVKIDYEIHNLYRIADYL